MNLDPSQLDLVRKLSGIGVSVMHIAHVLGVDFKAFAEEVERNQEIKTAIERGRAEAISTIASKAFDHAKSGNWQATYTWLKMHAGWSEHGQQDSQRKPIIIEFQDGRKLELTTTVSGKNES